VSHEENLRMSTKRKGPGNGGKSITRQSKKEVDKSKGISSKSCTKIMSHRNVSIEFLQKYSPHHAVVLTAINPKGKGIETKTFSNIEMEKCREFIEKHNDKWNLHFSVNPVRKRVEKKTDKGDILSLCW